MNAGYIYSVPTVYRHPRHREVKHEIRAKSFIRSLQCSKRDNYTGHFSVTDKY